MNELIQVVQLPVIEERLRGMKGEVEARVSAALSLVCTEETIQAVKKARSELNAQFNALEDQRKAVKKAVLGPYEQFESVYRECVSGLFKDADRALKDKVSAVEGEMKARCEEGLRAYFAELCTFFHVDFLRYEQAGIRVDMASARAKTPIKLQEQLSLFVERAAQDVETISHLEHAEEIMVEYRRTLDAGRAISAVQDRRRQMEEAREAQARRAEALERESQAAAKVEEALPPPLAPPAESAPPEPVVRCAFTVRATRSQLRKLKTFLMQEGIQYE